MSGKSTEPEARAVSSERLEVAARLLHLLGAAICLAAIAVVRMRQAGEMSSSQLAVFYGVPAAALLFFVAAAMARPAVRINLALLAAAAIVGVYATEIVLQLTPAPQQWEGIPVEVGAEDLRTKLQVVRDLRAGGIHAFPGYSPWLLRGLQATLDDAGAMPLAQGPSFSTTVMCNEGPGWLVYQTDEHGFRGNGSWRDRSQIVVLGDSFAAGLCVAEGEELPSRLRQRWPLTWNLGVAGAGPLHELAVLREFGPLLRPSVVVWVYYEGNDLVDLGDELASPLMARYLTPSFRLDVAARQPEVDRYLVHLLDSVYDATLAAEERGDPERPPRGLVPAAKETAKLTRLRGVLRLGANMPRENPLGRLPEIVRLGRDTAAAWGGSVLLVYLPAYARFAGGRGESTAGHEDFLAMAADLDVPVVDLASVFAAREDPRSLWIHPRGHLRPEGYRVAAEAIAEVIAAGVRTP